MPKRTYVFSTLALAVICVFLLANPAFAEQTFQLSTKFYEATFVNKQWKGNHHFGRVFCLTFPRANEVSTFAEAMYNNNTLYFSRAEYPNLTAIYVVASTIPAGRSVETEIGNMTASNQKGVDLYPKNFSLKQVSGELGPSLSLTIRNPKEGGKNSPFPFVRPIDPRPDQALASLSVHRLFVRENSRIEIAGLRYFKSPISAGAEENEISQLTALVEQAANSLQSCSSKIPPFSQKKAVSN